MKGTSRGAGSGEQMGLPGFEEFVKADPADAREPSGDAPAAKPEIPPTDEEWVDLYCAAAVLKKVAPWQWMWDSKVFGVKDPESGVIGYCAVMGRLGEHLALGVYLGAAGLAGLDALRERKKVDFLEFLSTQYLLQVSFEDRAELDSQDLKVIKRFEFVYRGKKSWPLFRSYRPGFMPWFVTGSEARFLNVAIRQALYLTQRFQDKPDLLQPPRPGMHLVRVSEPGEGGPVWRDQWIEDTPLPVEDTGGPEVVANASIRMKPRRGTWEVDVRPTPVPIYEPGKRPLIPLQILIADHDSGVIFDTDIREQTGYVPAFREHFIRVVDELGAAPERILLSSDRANTVIEPIARTLGIELRRVIKLAQLEPFYKSFEKYLNNTPPRSRRL